MAVTLCGGFALATWSIYTLACRAGLNPYLGVALGLLYAAGPYMGVNLFIRNAFPEYLMWQVAPALLLVVIWSVQQGAGAGAALAGALALAAPFYLHKLVAPHVALTLAVLAFNAAPWRVRTVLRIAFVGILAILFSVPAWFPGMRGLGPNGIAMLGGDSVPGVFHTSLVNLFWPVSANTLPAGPLFDFYEGRFALQAGLVPFAGFVLAMGTLLAQPRCAWSQRIVLPLLLFVVDTMLIMGWLWTMAPGPLRFVQFAYRLIGVVHLLGFVLVMQTLGSPEHVLRRLPPRVQRGTAVVLVMLALLGARTYWYEPEVSSTPSANLAPSDLGNNDDCSLCPQPRPSTLPPNVIPSEIPHDTWTRRAFGGAIIDASSLEEGYYVMPAYDYTFERVTDESGALVPTGSLDRRIVVEHTDATAYTIAYDFQPEMLALCAGAALFLFYAMVTIFRERSECDVRGGSAA